MPKTKKSSRLPLFDIRVDSIDKDTIVLKGPPNEAAPALLTGVIALSVTEPIHIRKMKLKLYSTLNMHWDEKLHSSNGMTFTRPFKFVKMLYCFDWDPINLERFLHTHSPLTSQFVSRNNSSTSLNSGFGFSTGKLIRSNPGSSTNLKSVGSSTTLKTMNSTTNNKSLSNLSVMNANSSHGGEITLQPGNYEFPFQVIIDGSTPETIFDHPCCSLVYRIQCVIERGRFSSSYMSRKLLHVVRTLSPDNSELSETTAVDNSWPDKIDYTISVPTKAIAIGSVCHVSMNLQPLCKGLRLGSIKIKLVEFTSFASASGQHNEEKTLTTKHITKMTTDAHGNNIWSPDAPVDADGVFYRGHNMVLSADRWAIHTSLVIPASLEKMTQSLDIPNIGKVRHKLKFSVGLINPDGHVSELRATLPITLFISPFVQATVKTIEEYEDPFQTHGCDDITVHSKTEKIIFSTHEVMEPIKDHLPSFDSEAIPAPNSTTQDLLAPPNYDNRVYDQLFDGSATLSRSTSRSNTNHPSTSLNERDLGSAIYTSEDETDLADLSTSVQSRGGRRGSAAGVNQMFGNRHKKPVFNMNGEDDDEEEDLPFDHSFHSHPSGPLPTIHQNVIAGPAFNTGERMSISHTPSQNHIRSPGIVTPVQHLSRAASFVGDPYHSGFINSNAMSRRESFDKNDSMWKELNKPPSYDVAIRSNASFKDLTPLYREPESNSDIASNLHLLDSRLQNLRLSRLDNQHADMSHPLSSSAQSSQPQLVTRKSFLNLGHITPSLSKNTSSTSLSLLKRSTKSNSGSSSNIAGLSEMNHSSSLPYSHTTSHGHTLGQHTISHYPTIHQGVTFDLEDSPNARSNASTPGIHIPSSSGADGYFPKMSSTVTATATATATTASAATTTTTATATDLSPRHSNPHEQHSATPKRPGLLSRHSSSFGLNLRSFHK